MLKSGFDSSELQEAVACHLPLSSGSFREALEAMISRLRKRLEDPSASNDDFDRWEDENYIYLEAKVEADEAPMLDVTVLGGRIFIRAERWT